MSALTQFPPKPEMQIAVQSQAAQTTDEIAAWDGFSLVPLRVSIYLLLEGISLRDLLQMRPGQILTTKWPVADDIPMRAGDAMLSWGEFENMDGRMAVRLTRLA